MLFLASPAVMQKSLLFIKTNRFDHALPDFVQSFGGWMIGTDETNNTIVFNYDKWFKTCQTDSGIAIPSDSCDLTL